MKPVLFSRRSRSVDPELTALKSALEEARGELAQAYCRFNAAVDPELVEACIYEISAIKARCNYLIRTIKSRSPDALAAAKAEEDILWS